MKQTAQALRDLILLLVPADGSAIGNHSLLAEIRQQLPNLEDVEYHEVKDGW